MHVFKVGRVFAWWSRRGAQIPLGGAWMFAVPWWVTVYCAYSHEMSRSQES